MNLLIINGSSRAGGNSEQLAEQLVAGLPAVNRLVLRDMKITPIVDERHSAHGFKTVADDCEACIKQLMTHDVLVFVTPLYWYSMSGLMKNFIDRWSQFLRSTDYDFKGAMQGKKVYLVVTGGPKVRRQGGLLVMQMQHICDFMGMEFIDYILGQGGKPGDIEADKHAVYQATELNQELLAGSTADGSK
ncbi:MAG: hypothetical protein RLZ12_1030 [Bacillota bacterium]|jgi:multimeric flavodoxin WrbA